MRSRTATRAASVSVGALALIVASQVLATMEPFDDPTDLRAGGAGATTTTEVTTTLPPTTTAAPRPPIEGPVRLLEESSRFDAPGVGPVEAGMTVNEAEQAAGRRFAITGHDPAARCFTAEPEGVLGLRFTVQGPVADPFEGRVVRAEATDSTWSTVAGARVGSSVAEVRRLYGRRLSGPATTTPTTGRSSSRSTTTTALPATLLTVVLREGGREYAVGFRTSERQVVAEVRSGDLAAVLDLVGCG
ncbi:MAG TPA: hypothetical protein VM933_03185 [Acidimicrobiales bacterium]|nr:hypothetical protein [Acidimicrobiales bacterium]